MTSQTEQMLARVRAVLQEADELGGPDAADYIDLMAAVMAEASKRAVDAVRNARWRP